MAEPWRACRERGVSLLVRSIVVMAALAAGSGTANAAIDCTYTEARKAGEQIVDWYAVYVKPYRPESAAASLTKVQVEALVEDMGAFHRRAVLDPLFFEALAQQILARYAGVASFRGIDASAAAKVYKSGAATQLDFSLLCIDAKTVRAPDDAFAITVFGVKADDCQHVGLRGLVFTDTWVNGSANGQCRPDQIYYRSWIIPVNAGTNAVTFVCRKDVGNCAR